MKTLIIIAGLLAITPALAQYDADNNGVSNYNYNYQQDYQNPPWAQDHSSFGPLYDDNDQ